jgi:hypothetical protein
MDKPASNKMQDNFLPARFPRPKLPETATCDFVGEHLSTTFRHPMPTNATFPLAKRFGADDTLSPGPSYNVSKHPHHSHDTHGKFHGGKVHMDRTAHFIPKPVANNGPGQYGDHKAWSNIQRKKTGYTVGQEPRFKNIIQEAKERVPGPYLFPQLQKNNSGVKIMKPHKKRRRHSLNLPTVESPVEGEAKSQTDRPVEKKSESKKSRQPTERKTRSSPSKTRSSTKATWNGRLPDKVYLGSRHSKKGHNGSNDGPGPMYYPNTSCFKSPSKSSPVRRFR